MRRRSSTLPLGIDIGAARIRIALTAIGADGPQLVAVATRDHNGDPRAAIADALAELQTRERRCALALGAPDAVLHELDLPAMPVWERMRAARFQAAQLIRYPVSEATCSLLPSADRGGWLLGIARRSAITRALSIAASVRLRTIAVDDHALALRRAIGHSRCIIDIGQTATRIAAYTAPAPRVVTIPLGGDQLTIAIARALGIDAAAAERRKRQVGFGGAGESERDQFIAAIVEAHDALQLRDAGEQQPIVLCGNGSRIPGFRAALAATLGGVVERAAFAPHISTALPADVLRNAAADWSVAYGLSLWTLAA